MHNFRLKADEEQTSAVCMESSRKQKNKCVSNAVRGWTVKTICATPSSPFPRHGDTSVADCMPVCSLL